MKKRKNKLLLNIRNIIILIVLIVFSILLVTVINGYNMYKDAISKISIEDRIAMLNDTDYYTNIKDIPDDFEHAIVSIEDHRFYEHGAIDMLSIGRAIVTNIVDMKLTEGGSTITQQLAKNMYFSQEKKFTRKIAEIFVAYDLQKLYDKDEILEYYLNIIYFGDGYYGIGQASQGYYKKSPSELTLYEQTLLAGLPNAPSAYALGSNSDLAKQRQNYVIDAMAEYNYLDENIANELKDTGK